jgi:SAM-dependent methyltransferase
MLLDLHRMEAYDRALRRLVRPGDVVLDLGCGTGVLAMLAARRGARVHAVESMPVVGLAAELARKNGLADRITFHRADALALAPVEPVDLVVSDFLGCFLVDDNMLPAARAAARWLKPGGAFAPARVRLELAPVADVALAELEIFDEEPLGLDLAAARPYALGLVYRVCLAPSALLAPAARYHDYSPTEEERPFDRALCFRFERAGLLRGLAGWFVADLAPGVALSTEPGVETHWGQLLFPLAAVPVAAGDRLEVRLALLPLDGVPSWRWEGELHRAGAASHVFSLDEEEWLGQRKRVGDG